MTDGRYGERYHRALEQAAAWHGDHTKKESDIPYISHLLTVSALVWEDGGDETEAIAALLHDTVEDEKATLHEVRDQFGDEVAIIVEHCTDAAPEDGEEKAPWFRRKVDHVTHLREVASQSGAEPTMRAVGADKLANVRSILVDHRSGQPDLWDRFKGGLGGSTWYYTEMTSLVGQVLPDSMLARELVLAVGALDELMADLGHGFGGADVGIASVLDTTAITGDIDATRFLAFELARSACAQPEDPDPAVASVLLRWFGQPPSGTPSRADLGDQVDVFDAVLRAITL